MTRERIEDMREVVLPFVKKRLLETNYEGLGEADAKEFEREFNEILNLAIKALEQEPRKGHWKLYCDCKNAVGYPQCNICGAVIALPLSMDNLNYCPNCGADMREVEE
jgi:hypothetical protein